MRVNDGRAIPAFINQALNNKDFTVFGDGLQTRSFCYIDDQVEGLIKLMNSNYNYPVNIGNPNELSIIELADRLKIITQSKSEVVFLPLPSDDPTNRKPDITLAKRLLNWEPKVGLEQGLRNTIEFMKK